jgi:hypothetical protein
MRKVINNLNGLLSKIYVGCLIWWGKVGYFFAFALFLPDFDDCVARWWGEEWEHPSYG